jgi:homoserine kinase type II
MQVAEVKRVLRYWLDAPAALVQSVESTGFSGARLWHIESAGRQFALRRWPDGGMSASRLAEVHAFQRRLAEAKCPVPSPLVCRHGTSFVKVDGRLWELSPWMPGVADYHAQPSREKLQAAFQALAAIHNASDGSSAGKRSGDTPVGTSAAIERRCARLDALVHEGCAELSAAIEASENSEAKTLARSAIRLAMEAAPGQSSELRSLRHEIFFLAWCLRDVWHEHILFTGDRVTGVIDFGAAAVDTPAGDVARLLGSMAGDNDEHRRFALAAYESIRPLWPVERDAINYFDSSGVVLAVLNWIHWLFRDSSVLAPSVDRSAAIDRFKRLVDRLRFLSVSR